MSTKFKINMFKFKIQVFVKYIKIIHMRFITLRQFIFSDHEILVISSNNN